LPGFSMNRMAVDDDPIHIEDQRTECAAVRLIREGCH
jgi:hypothetical protein